MRREDLIDLNAFLTVGDQRSFTRAAALLGTSQSSLSHTIRRLETRLGVRLLARTTRSVAPTEAGERLLAALRPSLERIEQEIDSLSDFRAKPAGSVRISTTADAATTALWPALERFLPDFPDVSVELSIDSGLTDIVAERFDAGVRIGELLDKDMIGVRIGPDLRMVVVGAPSYLAGRSIPTTPGDLAAHRCINMRLRTGGGFYAWEFAKDGRKVNVRVEGQIAFDDIDMVLRAAVSGFGLAFVMEDQAAGHVAAGRLVRVLDDWCDVFPGYHIYYPSQRQPSAAFAALVEALRWRGA